MITQVIEQRFNELENRKLQYPYEKRKGFHTSSQNGLGLLRPMSAVKRPAAKPTPLPAMNWARIWRFGRRTVRG